jgi:hypothetical protein
MVATRSFEMSVRNKPKRRHIPEDRILHGHNFYTVITATEIPSNANANYLDYCSRVLLSAPSIFSSTLITNLLPAATEPCRVINVSLLSPALCSRRPLTSMPTQVCLFQALRLPRPEINLRNTISLIILNETSAINFHRRPHLNTRCHQWRI